MTLQERLVPNVLTTFSIEFGLYVWIWCKKFVLVSKLGDFSIATLMVLNKLSGVEFTKEIKQIAAQEWKKRYPNGSIKNDRWRIRADKNSQEILEMI